MKTSLLAALRQAFCLAQQSDARKGHSTDDILHQAAAFAESRRRFLRQTARTGAVLALNGPAAGHLLFDTINKSAYKVAVVGAGMGGLSAGYFLRRKGVQATIFEADKRPGGRIKSARIFGDGALNTEIGAEFIDTSHSEMLFFARMLGLEDKLMDVEKDTFGERDLFFFDNRRYTLRDVLAEFKEAYPRIEADQKKLDGRHAAALDAVPMADYIEGLPLSGWAKKMLHAAYLGENGMETDRQSAANLLGIFEIRDNKFFPFGSSDERFKVIGGNEQIPQGLAKMLEPQIRYEHKLLSLRENNNRSITLSFSQNGTTLEETFDLVVMTLPFSILRDIDMRMELPPLKQRVIRELGYGTNSKFILETRNRPWRQAGYRGYLFAERIPNGWDSTQMQQNNEGTGTFTCFFGGERGKNAARGTEKEQLAHILPDLDGAFPSAAADLSGNMQLAHWPGNPFVKGSYSCFTVGQTSLFEGAAFEPVRRLYFAGEHCSTDYWGFMNGAAETGRRAAEKVLKKMRVR